MLNWTLPWGEHARDYEWVPNTFDTSTFDSVAVVSVCPDDPWEAPARLARAHDARCVLTVLPDLLQIKHRAYEALQRAEVPFLFVRPQQVEVIASLMSELPIRGVLCTHSVFLDLSQRLQAEKNNQVAYWEVILSPDDRPVCASQNVFFEVHLVPSLQILMQCKNLAGSASFHALPEYVYEHDEKRVRITDYRSPARFTRAELPHTFIISNKTCACGRDSTFTMV